MNALLRILGCALLALVAGCAHVPVSPGFSADALGDHWVGYLEGAGMLEVDFAADAAHLDDGHVPLGIIHPRVDHDAVRFTVDDGDHRFRFDLRLASGLLAGMVLDQKEKILRIELRRTAADDGTLDGTYRADGRLLFVDHGRVFDTRDGTDRRLFRLPSGDAFVPPNVLVRTSSGFRLGGHDATRVKLAREELAFVSEGVTLRGTLLAPTTSSPHPAAVYVHGSGHSRRQDPWENALARVFIDQGVAVFLYDKRGVGDSGGEYVGRGGRETNNVSAENLRLLAADARAAMALLASRTDIDAGRLGFIGLSQAGWIVPLAASKNETAKFVVLFSGPAVQTSVQLAYESIVRAGETCLPIADASRLVHDYAPRTGFDPAAVISELHVPALWFYGANDVLVPADESLRVLETLKPNHDFTTKLVPRAGHELYVVDHDSEEERKRSPGLSPVVLDTLRPWLAAHGLVRSEFPCPETSCR